MNCPECGAEHAVPPNRCHCGHIFPDTPVEPLYKGSDNDVHPVPRPRWHFRTCAKCGSVMVLYLVENMFLHYVIPTGKRFYFRCGNCGKEIKVRSLWRNLLAIPGCLMFPAFCAYFVYEPRWTVGIVTAIFGVYPVLLLLEIITRIRYPTVVRDSAEVLLHLTPGVDDVRNELQVRPPAGEPMPPVGLR